MNKYLKSIIAVVCFGLAVSASSGWTENFKEAKAQAKKEGKKLSSQAIAQLQKYHFPGNVRELQHAIERVIIMSEGDNIQPDDFFFLSQSPAPQEEIKAATLNLDDMEKTAIEKALHKYNGNISRAAKELGLTRASLYRRLEKYGI